jgi:hypothetical protein
LTCSEIPSARVRNADERDGSQCRRATSRSSSSGATQPTATLLRNATANSGRATVSWIAPSYDGGSPVTGDAVTAYVGYGPVKTRIFNPTLTTQTVTGLTNVCGPDSESTSWLWHVADSCRTRFRFLGDSGSRSCTTLEGPPAPDAAPRRSGFARRGCPLCATAPTRRRPLSKHDGAPRRPGTARPTRRVCLRDTTVQSG